jgi:hypothetical protein
MSRNGFFNAETQRRRENLIVLFSLRLCVSAAKNLSHERYGPGDER